MLPTYVVFALILGTAESAPHDVKRLDRATIAKRQAEDMKSTTPMDRLNPKAAAKYGDVVRNKTAVEMAPARIMDKIERGGLVEDWEKEMQGFSPELLLTFDLKPRTDEFFFEEIDKQVYIRGAFFARSEVGESTVDFQITDPSGDMVRERSNVADGIFHFQARKKGIYTFVLSNHKWMEAKTVTFAIGRGDGNDHLHFGHLNDTESKVKDIERKLRDIQTESTYLWIRQNAHMKTVESVQRRVFWFCLLELITLCSISGFQVFYIKGLLSDRRVI